MDRWHTPVTRQERLQTTTGVAGAGNRYGCAHCAWACLHLAAAMHQLTCHAHSLEKCIYVTDALPGTCTPTGHQLTILTLPGLRAW